MVYAKLRGRIAEKYRRQRDFARDMGLSQSTLSGRLSGARDWTRQDIANACRLLGISFDEIPVYFFNPCSCKIATEEATE